MQHERFTKGPWRDAYDDDNGQAVIMGEHTEVATCWHHCVGSLEKQMRANARLIAAAPDLLALLIEAAEFIQPFNGVAELYDRIEVMITAALGEDM